MDFEIVLYELHSGKLSGCHRIALLADLHNTEHGPENADLIRAVRELDPEMILCPGDMILGKSVTPFDITLPFMRELSLIAPVFLSNGNHETRLRLRPSLYSEFEEELERAGIRILNNSKQDVVFGGDRFEIFGFETDENKYKKFRRQNLTAEEMKLAFPEETAANGYRILLAHNPAFAETYAQWGADLAVCGHYHGGMVRTGKNRAMFSPYGGVLPKYGYGHYRIGQTDVVVTSGLGDHTIPFRVKNPMEIVCLEIRGEKRDAEG